MSGKIKRSKMPTMPQKCSCCGRKNVKLTFRTDPYSVEICDDNSKRWICDDCVAQRAEDI